MNNGSCGGINELRTRKFWWKQVCHFVIFILRSGRSPLVNNIEQSTNPSPHSLPWSVSEKRWASSRLPSFLSIPVAGSCRSLHKYDRSKRKIKLFKRNIKQLQSNQIQVRVGVLLYHFYQLICSSKLIFEVHGWGTT